MSPARPKLRVVIVDDHTLFREGCALSSSLSSPLSLPGSFASLATVTRTDS